MAKENSFEKKSGTGRSTSQAKESPKVITPSWSHFETAPHESWVNNETADNEGDKKPVAVNKAVEKVKEGDISSRKSEKVVYGKVASNMKDKWKRNFDENIKNKPFVVKDEIEKRQAKAPVTRDGKTGEKMGNSPEQKHQNAKEMALKRQAERGAAPEQVVAYEKSYDSWKESRDKAHQAEAAYKEAYSAHILKESSTLGFIKNWPRRRFGLQPRLSESVQRLKDESDRARVEYKNAAKGLKENRLVSNGTTDAGQTKLIERYQRSLAHHLTIGVHKERLEIQQDAIKTGWENNKLRSVSEKKNALIRSTIETIRRNPKKATALLVGVGVIAPAMLATVGAAAGAGLGIRALLTNTWVKSSVKNLERASATSGENFLEKDFKTLDNEIGKLTFQKQSREEKTKTAAWIAASAAGAYVGSALYTGNEGVVPNSPESIDVSTPAPKQMGDLSVMEEMQDLADKNESVSPKEMGDLKVMEEMQALSDKSSNIPPKEMGDLRVMEEMQDLADQRGSAPPKEMGDLRVMEEVEELAGNRGRIELADIPNSELEGVPVELKGNASELPDIPEPKLEGVPAELEIKGSIEHADIPEPELEGVPPIFKGSTFELPEIPNPELEGVPDDLVKEYPVEHPDIVEPKMEDVPPVAETVPKSPDVTRIVGDGENAWNIAEGRGSDANPTNGASLYLKELNLATVDRQFLLDQAIDYLEKHPELAKEIGAVRSNGNIHMIWPGEVFNVTKFDDLLRTLHEGNDPGAMTEVPAGETEEFNADKSEAEPPEPVNKVMDMNDISLNEVLALSKGVSVNDLDALARLEELGWDDDSLMDMIDTLKEYGSKSEINLDMTVREFLNETKPVFRDLTPSETSGIPEATPYGPNDPIPGPGATDIVRDASVTTTETPEQSLNNYVSGIEQSKGGGILDVFDNLFGGGKPNIEGSYEAMQAQDLSVGDIRKMVAEGSVPAGMKEAGFDTWVAEMNKVAANDNERFVDVIARVANSRAA